LERIEHRPIEMVRMRAGGLRDERMRMHHGDLCDLFAPLLLAVDRLAMDTHLRVLAGEGAGRRLAAGVAIDLRIQDKDLHMHAAGKQPRERLKTDIEHRTVAAE